MKIISYVYTDGGIKILHRVQARDTAHAIEKLQALYGIQPEVSRVMPYSDWKADSDLVLEQTGRAPWQQALNRQERQMERKGHGLI